MVLLDARGQPLKSANYKKAPTVVEPRSGAPFGQWAGRDAMFLTLPGGGVMQFDLSKLTLTDYRSMREHYQLGSSLNVLSFMMHQIEWEIKCDEKDIKDMIEEDLRLHWTPLVRGISQAFWAGYSPMAVNYVNGPDQYTHLDNFKDLIPEECYVNWKKIKGWAPPGKLPPTIHEYDGFKQNGFLIPPENTLWYPLLMENGDHYGRKLLKAAFPAWFFSNLIHLFANRYFERFGEPLPVGRGRFGDDLDMGDGQMINGKKAMENVVTGIRNRAVVVLPSDRDPVTKEYDYDIQYLESQMRGADFERYLSRLDEEMSLAVFTPVLLFRTADVGSYNLGQAHLLIFQQMLNAIAGDMQYYIQNYLVDRLKVMNFPDSEKVKCNWVYRKQGNVEAQQYAAILEMLIREKMAKPDMEELGNIVGLKLTEVEQIVAPPPAPAPADPNAPKTPPAGKTPPAPAPKPKPKVKAGKSVLDEAVVRVSREVGSGKVPTVLGYRNRFVEALLTDGFSQQEATEMTETIYRKMNLLIENIAPVAESADDTKNALQQAVDLEIAV
jgi:hypothetical protein